MQFNQCTPHQPSPSGNTGAPQTDQNHQNKPASDDDDETKDTVSDQTQESCFQSRLTRRSNSDQMHRSEGFH